MSEVTVLHTDNWAYITVPPGDKSVTIRVPRDTHPVAAIVGTGIDSMKQEYHIQKEGRQDGRA